ncbi:hypothetical protein [Pseudomonas sp. RL]|uniref:hypothetical protein n=1 Tax=Pseudomonas sp. RL TaxID=1452718 RepID=UPI000562AD73|nr:hypothetical protein [Pseudomonas sp. RL]
MVTTELNDRVLAELRSNDFSGYDPYDFLNSILFKRTFLSKSYFARLAWIQFGKLSPVNFRPLFLVPKKRNPKGIAIIILGLLEDYRRSGDKSYLADANELAAWLQAQCCDRQEWKHACWGYHFDWQARAFFVPTGKPNIITTTYVARALFELGELTSNEEMCYLALDSARFISKFLYMESDNRCFFAYIPGETAFVHNASLWGAAWCAFAGKKLGDECIVNQALSVARQSVSEQLADGSWVYGTRHHHNFIDGFHTGYNLEALCLLRDAIQTGEFDSCISNGYSYYVRTFISDDGVVKYYDNNVYPIDMHSFSQAILTLLKVGGKQDFVLCDRVVERAVQLLFIPGKARFFYQKTRWIRNSINYTRWTQAWGYYSLAFFNRFRVEMENAQD